MLTCSRQVCGEGKPERPRIRGSCLRLIALSIAAFERTALFGQFNSKYDAYLQDCLMGGGLPDDCAMGIGPEAETAGADLYQRGVGRTAALYGRERQRRHPGQGRGSDVRGLPRGQLYSGPGQRRRTPWAPDGMVPPVFTDFTYDNLGVPVNPEIAALTGAPQPTTWVWVPSSAMRLRTASSR